MGAYHQTHFATHDLAQVWDWYVESFHVQWSVAVLASDLNLLLLHSQVRDWYVESFRELRGFPKVKDASDELQFTRLLQHIYRRHTNVVPVMAMGVAGAQLCTRCALWCEHVLSGSTPTWCQSWEWRVCLLLDRLFSLRLCRLLDAYCCCECCMWPRWVALDQPCPHPPGLPYCYGWWLPFAGCLALLPASWLPRAPPLHLAPSCAPPPNHQIELKRELSQSIHGLDDLPDIHQVGAGCGVGCWLSCARWVLCQVLALSLRGLDDLLDIHQAHRGV